MPPQNKKPNSRRRAAFTWLQRTAVILLLLGLLSACAGSGLPPGSADRTPAQQALEAPAPETNDGSPQPTAIAAGGQQMVDNSGITPAIPDTGGEPPARFIFPTQAPPPKSAWRPPLYPVPWALRDQDHFFFIRPIPVKDVNWPLANYRYGGIFFQDVVHTGVDIPGPAGTPVLAAGPGKVVWSGYGLLNFSPGNLDDPYGLAIAIQHDFGYKDQPLYTLYAHLSESDVVVDQVVNTGDVIGLTGETGVVTGPHLHFEVRIGHNDFFSTRNPELWTAPPQGWGVLAGRVMDTKGELLFRKEVVVTSLNNYQVWLVMTYGPKNVNSDPYYQENVAMGDLPAGLYQLDIQYGDEKFSKNIQIVPGTVSYFTFQGDDGFSLNLPATPTVDPEILAP
jgi:murein DD-endopeptidase MepM/ murein hydrolase activator NlpD